METVQIHFVKCTSFDGCICSHHSVNDSQMRASISFKFIFSHFIRRYVHFRLFLLRYSQYNAKSELELENWTICFHLILVASIFFPQTLNYSKILQLCRGHLSVVDWRNRCFVWLTHLNFCNCLQDINHTCFKQWCWCLLCEEMRNVRVFFRILFFALSPIVTPCTHFYIIFVWLLFRVFLYK